MFNSSKYTKWYFGIISNAVCRQLDGYYEIHHIIPKSLGGNNNKNNLVKLTAREHFICHLLLPEMVSGLNQRKMTRALLAMSLNKTGSRYTSRLFEHRKQQLFDNIKGKRWSQAQKLHFSKQKRGKNNPNFGKSQASNHLLKHSQNRVGVPRTIEERKNIATSKMIKMCNTVLKHFDEITPESLSLAKKQGIIAKTHTTKISKIKEVLGFIPDKKVHS